MEIFFGLLILAVLFICLIKGVVKTFKRQPIIAILMIIFLFPCYLIWAFCELFTGTIDENKKNDLSLNVNLSKGTVNTGGTGSVPTPMPKKTRTSADKQRARNRAAKDFE